MEQTSLKIKTHAEYTPGLICLKGGDLTTEVQESGTRPRIVELSSLFKEEFLKKNTSFISQDKEIPVCGIALISGKYELYLL